MVFGLFKKTDPVCGMKEEKGKGITKHGQWFCNESCLKKYDAVEEKDEKKHEGSCCCH